ncbi:hypothetical protein [Bradyrhizobium japonicum]|uniref:hypothetical protein n=1 Tax=Bradyrhizobium japonicum TaxID=375 RepID=UPI00041A0EC7|nr:hypothetical protein [Bradyrhizobium japonicum]
MPFYNFCKWQASTIGTGSFGIGAAAEADDISTHDVPENCDVVDGAVYRYYARTADGSQTEWGHGTYSTSSHTLARTTIILNSDGTTSPVDFLVAPIVDMFPSPQKSVANSTIPSGTKMLFQQSNAPTGWTKQTTHNDKALRVVSGTASSGGTSSFSAMFASRTSDVTTLSIAQMPVHDHAYTDEFIDGVGTASWNAQSGADRGDKTVNKTTGTAGGGGSHAHTLDMRVQYVDLIIAQRN